MNNYKQCHKIAKIEVHEQGIIHFFFVILTFKSQILCKNFHLLHAKNILLEQSNITKF